jgi:hypothetical protein
LKFLSLPHLEIKHMKSRQCTLGVVALMLTQLLSFKTSAQCCVAPVNLTVTLLYRNGFPADADLQWKRVQEAGCTTPVKYKFQRRAVGSTVWITGIVTTQPNTTIADTIVNGFNCLCGGITYEWRIQGICSDTNKTAFVRGPNFKIGFPFVGLPVTTSPASAISSQGKFTIIAYPNPVANELKLSGNLKAGGPVNIQIINSVGQMVLREDRNFSAGDFNTGIDVSKLPPGVYLVVVNDKTERTTLSIVKQ